jgi:alpha-D-ribose 1-methylphosphonate 5-triphosphate synthase subunit PhnH
MSAVDTLSGGFADPATDAARAFRAILAAMAQPGLIVRMVGAAAPAPASPAAAAAMLALADNAAPVHLAGAHDTPALHDWLAFHCGARGIERAQAAFALGTWAALMPLSDYPAGSAEYPDRSTTLIVELPELANRGARLSGPGIEGSALLSLPALAPFAANTARFPLGLDFLFTCGDMLAALPRSTRVEVG